MILVLYHKKRGCYIYVLYFYMLFLLFSFSVAYHLKDNKQFVHLGKRKKTHFYILVTKNKYNNRKQIPSFSTCSRNVVISNDIETKKVQKNELHDEIEIALAQKIERGIDKLLYVNRNLIEISEEFKQRKSKAKSVEVLGKVNIIPVEKKKKKKKKRKGESLLLLSDECLEEINELIETFNFTFYSPKIQKWKNVIKEIIEGKCISLENKQLFSNELDQMFLHFLFSFSIDDTNNKEKNETKGTDDENVSKYRNDIKKDHIKKEKTLNEILNNVAKKIVLFRKIITDLIEEYKIFARDVYIDIKTHDIKVERKNINEKMSDWKVIFLGTGSMYPSTYRGTSSFIFQTTKKEFNEGFLFDCGENTFLSLQKANIKVSQIKNVFITHLHGDHCLGLVSVLTMLTNLNRINIYGPEGLYKFLKNNLNYTYSKRVTNFCVHELKHVNVNRMKSSTVRQNYNNNSKDNDKKQTGNPVEDDPQKKKENGNMQLKYIYINEENAYPLLSNKYLEITGFPIKHTIPTIGYIIKEKNVKNKFNASYINEIIGKNFDQLKLCEYLQFAPYKIYENIIGKMKENDVFTFPDKTKLTFKNAYKEIYKDRKIVICQDTYDPSSLEKFAKDADLLIHEATNSLIDLEESKEDSSFNYDICYTSQAESYSYEKEKKHNVIKKKLQEEKLNNENTDLTKAYNKIITERGHSTANMAGTFAKKIGAKKLILTHFSQRYIGDNKLKNVIVMKKIEEEARISFGSVADLSSHSDICSNVEVEVSANCNKNQGAIYGEKNTEETYEANTRKDDEKEEDKVVAAWDGLIVHIPHQILK